MGLGTTEHPRQPISLGVVTVTYNAAAYLAAFLASCLAQTHASFALLVIDNASSDNTLEIVRGLGNPLVHVLANADNIGYAAACNQGIRYFNDLGTDEILFINNDTEFGSGLFSALSELRRKQMADAVTPRVTYFDDPARDWYAGGRFTFWKGFQGQHVDSKRSAGQNAPEWMEVAPGCCVLFQMTTFRKIGLFDPTYFVYYEDTDFFLRMQRAGLRLLYAPGATIAHKVSLSTGGPQSDFTIRYHQRNQMYVLRKHFGWPIVVAQLPVIFAKATLRLLVGRDTLRQFRLRIRGIREGLAVPLPAEELALTPGERMI